MSIVTGSFETFLYSTVIFPATGLYFSNPPIGVATEVWIVLVKSVASTQLVVQRFACRVSQPISTGSAASMVMVTAWFGINGTADLIGVCTTAAWTTPAQKMTIGRIERVMPVVAAAIGGYTSFVAGSAR